jgi:hypothetical protein
MLRRFVASASLLLAASGCNASFPFDKTVPFHAQRAAGASPCVELTRTESLADMKEFQQAKQYIKRIEVVGVDVEVTQVAAANTATKVSGFIDVAAEDGSGKVRLATLEASPVATGNVVTVQPTADGMAKADELLRKSPHAIQLTAQLCADKVPADFHGEATLRIVGHVGL